MRFAIVLATIAIAGSGEPLTETGDIIGSVTMRPDRSLHMMLHSVQCNGTIVEGIFDIKRGQKDYQLTIDHVGGLQSNETKPVPAWPTPNCSSNQDTNSVFRRAIFVPCLTEQFPHGGGTLDLNDSDN
jgi:hypothetical protein